MKSTRQVTRSRAAGSPLDMVRELVIAAIIYFGPPIVCAVPLLFLYWIYRPTALPNPGLSALKIPAAMALLPPPSQPESREDAGTSNQAALADSAEDFAEPEPADTKPKGPPGAGGSHPTVGGRNVRFAGSARSPTSAHNVSAAVANPGQYTGMSRGPASAYAYAAEQSGGHGW